MARSCRQSGRAELRLVEMHVIVVRMYYMNTDRDNFHDWARDKSDTTSFSGLHRSELHDLSHRPGVRWGRLVFLVLLAFALIAGFKYVAGL